MAFLALLAHRGLQANPLVAYQVVLDHPEIRDYQAHQVMSNESFETNNFKAQKCVHLLLELFV